MTTPEHRGTEVPPTSSHDEGASRAYADEPRGAPHTETHTATAPRRDRDHGNHEVAASRDLIRWGPLWAGVMIVVATYLVMQLAIFAGGLFADAGQAGTWLSAAAALVAFFLGGLAVGATALWHKVSDGITNGAVMWAFATVTLLVLALLGGGTLLGPVSTVASDLVQVQDLNLQNPPADQVNEALQGARDAAGWALLGLGLAFLSSILGGAAGAKIWPNRDTAGTTARDADTSDAVHGGTHR